jgi:transitional endoplasmic reticulum ATPase
MFFPSSVSSLIIFASIESDNPTFANVLKDQIDILQKQLEKSFKSSNMLSNPGEYQSGPHDMDPSGLPKSNQRDIRTLLDALSDCTTRIGIDAARPRIYESGREISGTESGSNRDIRALLDAVSDSLASLDLPSLRAYESAPPHRGHALENSGNEEGRNFRALLDRMTTQKNRIILGDPFYPPRPPPKEYNPSTRGPGYRHPGAPSPSSSQPIMSLPTLKDQTTRSNTGVNNE